MEFPVPQFTDVEDRIIGGLTFKQFGIVFAVGVVIFAVYTVSKNIPSTVFAGIFLGLPGLALAFGKLNGRPIYSNMNNLLLYITGNNMYFFSKQASEIIEDDAPLQVNEAPAVIDPKETAVKIQQLGYLLQQQSAQESVLIGRLKEKQISNLLHELESKQSNR